MWHESSILFLNNTGVAEALTKGAIYKKRHDPLCLYWEAFQVSILDTQMGSACFP